MPEGSIGRAYYDFVHREGLSADGLIASSEEAPKSIDWLSRAMARRSAWDIHDLQHG